jgi:hypothetical protein
MDAIKAINEMTCLTNPSNKPIINPTAIQTIMTISNQFTTFVLLLFLQKPLPYRQF